MRNKTCPVRVKLLDDSSNSGDAAGTFEALVSVFGVKDSYGEVVMPGAFARTLSNWEESGNPIPVYWSHRLDDPDFNIGHVLEAKETDEGLYVKAQLDLDNAKAQATHNLLRSRRVTQFSFSFSVPPGGANESEDGSVLELSDIELYELGPTPIGANPETELISAKSGRVLSAKNVEKITNARQALKDADTALAELLNLTSDDEKSRAGRRTKNDEPALGAKFDESTPTTTLDSVFAKITLAAL